MEELDIERLKEACQRLQNKRIKDEDKRIKARDLTNKMMKDEDFRNRMFDAVIPRLKEKGITTEQISNNNKLLFELYLQYDFNTDANQVINLFLQKMQK